MHSFRSLVLAAAGLFLTTAVSGHRSPGGMVRRSANANTSSLQTTLNTLKYKVGPITYHIETLAKAANASSNATTVPSLEAELMGLYGALNASLVAVGELGGSVAGDVNLLDLAHTIGDIVEDVVQALVALENAVALVPVLAPIIKELSAILNGPLTQLLNMVTGLVSGLLPVVQKILTAVGVDTVLKSLQGVIGGLVGVLGL